MTRVSVRLAAYVPESLVQRVEAFRLRYHMSLSTAVRHLVERGLEAEERGEGR